MSTNTNPLVAALVQGIEDGTIDLTGLLSGVKPVTVKRNRRTATYTKVDGTVVACTPKQAKAWKKKVTLTPEERAVKQAKAEEFVAKKRAYAAARAEQGLPSKKDQRFANRAAAELLRNPLTKAEFDGLEWTQVRDLILTTEITVPAFIADLVNP